MFVSTDSRSDVRLTSRSSSSNPRMTSRICRTSSRSCLTSSVPECERERDRGNRCGKRPEDITAADGATPSEQLRGMSPLLEPKWLRTPMDHSPKANGSLPNGPKVTVQKPWITARRAWITPQSPWTTHQSRGSLPKCHGSLSKGHASLPPAHGTLPQENGSLPEIPWATHKSQWCYCTVHVPALHTVQYVPNAVRTYIQFSLRAYQNTTYTISAFDLSCVRSPQSESNTRQYS